MNVTREQLIEAFINGGLSEYAAYGFASNWKQESSFNPKAVNVREQAYGLGQWRGSRLAHFRNQFKKDLKEATWEEQVEFALWELKNTEKRAAQEIAKAQSAFEAGAAVSRYYERPSAVEKEATNRGRVAQEWWNADKASGSPVAKPVGPETTQKASQQAQNSGQGVGVTDKEAVKALQAGLNAVGASPELLVDGIPGVATRSALIAFQSLSGLVPDGVFGPKSKAALEAAQKKGTDISVPSSSKKMRIILVRGKLGDAPFGFSLGMDELARKLNKISGVTATVDNYGLFYSMSDDIALALSAAAKAGQLIGCIGHSMGADTALKVALYLQGFGQRLNLAGPVDPTPFGCPHIPGNVDVCVAYRNTLLFQLGGYEVQPSAEFNGKLERYDLAMAHTAIDDYSKVHDEYIAEVKELMK